MCLAPRLTCETSSSTANRSLVAVDVSGRLADRSGRQRRSRREVRAAGPRLAAVHHPLRLRDRGGNKPVGFALEAKGDLSGRGEWTFRQDGAYVVITYDWRITADKPLLRALSPVRKPVLRSNHNWTMRKGEESLNLELWRRRGAPGRAATAGADWMANGTPSVSN